MYAVRFLNFPLRQKFSKFTVSSGMQTGENPDSPVLPCDTVREDPFLA